MPSAGYSHFYLSAKETAPLTHPVVGPYPRRPILISTRRYGTPLRTLQRCQCPRRAILISTHRTKCGIALPSSVSMPSAGYSHFYYADMSRFILMNC